MILQIIDNEVKLIEVVSFFSNFTFLLYIFYRCEKIKMNLYFCILNRHNQFTTRLDNLRYFSRRILTENQYRNGSILRTKPLFNRNNGINQLTFISHRNMSNKTPQLRRADITRLFSLAKPERWKLTGKSLATSCMF